MHMSLKQARRLAGAMAASAALGLGAFASTASAAAAPAHTPAKHEYCAVVVAPPRSSHSPSRVLSHTCSTKLARGGDRPAGFDAGSLYKIITIYQYTNYTGNSLSFYESSECPAKGTAGWPLQDTRPSDLGWGDWGASSWKASSSCWATTLYYGTNFGGPKYQYAQGVYEAGQIGSPWGNHVWSIWTGYER